MSVWFIPALCVTLAIVLSFAADALNSLIDRDTAWFLFGGGPEGARTVLSAVATSMMTFTGVVFSVTILVLQLASRQFSPRVLRTFLRDRGTQLSLGVFVGTFTYALLSLRSVRGATGSVEQDVPALSVWFAVVLAVVSVATFIYYLHHVAQSIRAVEVLRRIFEETRHHLKHMYPEGIGDAADAEPRWPDGPPDLVVLHLGKSGIIASVAEDRLWRCLKDANVVIAMRRMVGDFLPHGSPLFEVWGDPKALDIDGVVATVTFTNERTPRQDTAFGFRQIVDIAERALSTGVNDPSTAVQAIDELHALLRQLARRRFPSPFRLDEHGHLRLVLPRPDWSAYVALAFDEIRHSGAGSIQVVRRLRFVIADLMTVVPPFRTAPLMRQLALLDASIERSFDDAPDAAMAHQPSPQGHGPH